MVCKTVQKKKRTKKYSRRPRGYSEPLLVTSELEQFLRLKISW